MKHAKTIALVDWNWQGHHPTYFNYFILALEELGVDVLALCPNPEAAEKTANETRPRSGSSLAKRGQTHFRKIKISDRRFGRLLPVPLVAIDWTIRHFAGIEKQVREWASVSGDKVDAIYYACMYDRDFEWVSYAQPFLRFPWMGLYLHAMSFRAPGRRNPATGRTPCPEKMFGGRLCRAICILDEGIAEQVSKTIGKPVVTFPDLTDERLPAHSSAMLLGGRLKRWADGRPIVGLFGHLQRSKGILALLEAARMPGASEICFALGGEIIWPVGPGEASQMQLTLAECPNIWNHLVRIPDGEQMNSLLAACDIIYAAYLDFPHSSNIMTKAAFLKKPLIVSDGYLMAERVQRFNMGEIVPQSKAPELLEAILKISKDPVVWVADNQPRWGDYCEEHSYGRLKASFDELLGSV